MTNSVNQKVHGIRSIGIDFGTTNTVISAVDASGSVHTVPVDYNNEMLKTFYSALCFWQERGASGLITRVETGPWAIEKYSDLTDAFRFLQSIKTFAASSAFTGTYIFGKLYHFEDLMCAFLMSLFEHAKLEPMNKSQNVVVGRPVKFAGSNPSDSIAMKRYRKAFANLGMTDVTYAYEPVGAAFYYAQKLTHDATVLVADFGGGTSDFSIVQYSQTADGLVARPLGNQGIGIAGDVFDYRLIDNLVLPLLGKGGHYTSMGEKFDLPIWPFHNFARWNHLSMMKANGELQELRKLCRTATDSVALERFIEIIDNDYVLALYQAISEAKAALSAEPETVFRFERGSINIAKKVTRQQFESWIGDDLVKISKTLKNLLIESQMEAGGIDKVFLTGGSSLIPAIRNLFANMFGAEKLDYGDQFVSISNGLALIGNSKDIARWSVI